MLEFIVRIIKYLSSVTENVSKRTRAYLGSYIRSEKKVGDATSGHILGPRAKKLALER